MRILVVLLAALALAPAASPVGPWLGTATTGAGYDVASDGISTTITGEAGSLSVAGDWGLPRVTLAGAVGGSSADGRVLVLAEAGAAEHPARATAFLVLTTSPLRVARTLHLSGDYGFDALSSEGNTLYLIQHVASSNWGDYRVRAYDLRVGRLLPRAIADKRQRGWLMSGYPVARATSAAGRWVYTLYWNPDNYPFVHALDTSSRTAICVGLPWAWRADATAIMQAKLRLDGRRLLVGRRFAVDTATFRVSKT